MAVFYSFDYERDHWRVQQILNMGQIDGQQIPSAQEWEKVKSRGRNKVKSWIDENMKHKTAVVVLIGSRTASRRWVQYEIEKAWTDRRPLLGVRIHGLKGKSGRQSPRGDDPFARIRTQEGVRMSKFVPVFSPGGPSSETVYQSLQTELPGWVKKGYRRP